MKFILRRISAGALFGLSGLSAVAQTDTTYTLREVKVLAAPIPGVKTIVPSQHISSTDFTRYSAYNAADAIRNFSGRSMKMDSLMSVMDLAEAGHKPRYSKS